MILSLLRRKFLRVFTIKLFISALFGPIPSPAAWAVVRSGAVLLFVCCFMYVGFVLGPCFVVWFLESIILLRERERERERDREREREGDGCFI